MDLKTPVGKKFLELIDLHFPKGSILHPLINRNKVKLSYRCLPNMGSTISKHNKKILNNDPRCQCKYKLTCPIPGKCATDKVIYRATVTTSNDVQTYVELTAGPFKARFSKGCLQKKTVKFETLAQISQTPSLPRHFGTYKIGTFGLL